jgi:hypothetical protein
MGDGQERVPRILENMERESQAVVAEEAELPLIQDFEEWLRNNALRDSSESQQRSELNRNEESNQFQEQLQYQQEVHKAIFSDREAQERQKQAEKQKQIDSWSNVHIHVVTADCIIPDVSLKPMAKSCDVVFALASSRDLFASKETMQLSLERFQEVSVREFVSLVVGAKKLHDIAADAVVDCCQIAHYLQNAAIVDCTVDILLQSIDTANCMSLCQLADQLELPTLFERSLSFMMNSLGDLEANGAWDDLTVELKERIGSIQSAIQSSIHSQHSRLYFSSLHEYLAIFAETVQYNQERLAEAKEQHGHTTSRSGAWKDTQDKIERQERRVQTLEAVLKEQKKLFKT